MVGCWAALGLGPFWDLSHQLPSGHTLASGDPPPRDERPRRLPPLQTLAPQAASPHAQDAVSAVAQDGGLDISGGGARPGPPHAPAAPAALARAAPGAGGPQRGLRASGSAHARGTQHRGGRGAEDGPRGDHTGQLRPGRQRLGLRTLGVSAACGRLFRWLPGSQRDLSRGHRSFMPSFHLYEA